MDNYIAEVLEVQYRPSFAVPFLKQGVKNGRRPNNGKKTLGGSNGSFVQLDSSPNLKADILVTVRLRDGSSFPISIRRDVLAATGRKRIDRQLASKIQSAAPDRIQVQEEGNKVVITKSEIDEWTSQFSIS